MIAGKNLTRKFCTTIGKPAGGKQVVLSGIQPTGVMHLGNYLGAVKNWVNMQEYPDTERYYCVVDLHSLTTNYVSDKDSKDQIESQEQTLKTAANLIA